MKATKKTFTKLYPAQIITNALTGEMAVIYKYQKDGTKRVFFAPEVNGKRTNTTLWAVMKDAARLAKHYLNRPI